MAIAPPAVAHETDQYTIPAGREFADLGDYLTKYFYEAIKSGADRQNEKIRQTVELGGGGWELRDRESVDELVSTVKQRFPIALVQINDFDKLTTSKALQSDYPGRLIGYKTAPGVRRYVDFPLNPFKAWGCATIRAYGLYFGSDKIGHFTDMGVHYYREYRTAKFRGAREADAVKAAVAMGTHGPVYSERGVLGLVTSAAYSNADLAANYMGFCFYKNLTEPVLLKGELRPPMLVRDGHYWKLNDHVRPDSDFFSWFIPDHFDEALNPSYYRSDIRNGIRRAIVESRDAVLSRYRDANGQPLTERQLEDISLQLVTYYGSDYGHLGDTDELMTIGRTCFAPAPNLNDPKARNGDGLTSLHYAATRGDVDSMRRLIAAGADINARVISRDNVPAVNGDTPLHQAARDGRVDAVRLLLAGGANPNLANDRGATPLHTAVQFPQVMAVLIDGGADVDEADATGRTPLHWAARGSNDRTSVATLLDHGALPQLPDREGQTALHDAARAANKEAIVALIRGGADVDSTDRFGLTPLHLAARGSSAAAVEVLVQAGAPINAKDDFGCTPILVAAGSGQPQIVAELLEHGADARLADAYGVTPAAIADQRGLLTVSEVLGAVTPADAVTVAAKIGPPSSNNIILSRSASHHGN